MTAPDTADSRFTMSGGELAVMGAQCTVHSPRGVVVAAAPSAAHIGARMLEDGGNAFDAATAAALAETVLLPPKCGLAGDLVAITWRRGHDAPVALTAIGGAPAGLAAVAERGDLAETGPYSVGVPGAPSGYVALAERGRLGLSTLAAPAIRLADDGFCWSSICTVLADDSHALVAEHQPDGCVYYPGGTPIAPGAVVTLPGLARALEHLVDDEHDFLRGPVGDAIVERVRRGGGILDHADLVTTPRWEAAVRLQVGNAQVWATPAPTHGPSLLDALDRASPAAAVVGPNEVYQAVASAVRARKLSLSDPSGTSMVSAVDADGTMVVIVHSNSFPQFGSGLIAEEFDLILANRAGRGFTAEPGHPNAPVAGRRPATTLHAWALGDHDGTRLIGATPGGANQMPWNAQSLVHLLAPGRLDAVRLAEAVVGPRWQFDKTGGHAVEAGYSDEDVEGLSAVVPDARHVARWGLRSAMQIVGELDGAFIGIGDPRTQCGLAAL